MRDEIIALLGFLMPMPTNGQGEPLANPSLRPRSILSAISGALTPDANAGGLDQWLTGCWAADTVADEGRTIRSPRSGPTSSRRAT